MRGTFEIWNDLDRGMWNWCLATAEDAMSLVLVVNLKNNIVTCFIMVKKKFEHHYYTITIQFM